MARDRLLKQALRDRFLVTMSTGETFDGLLDEHDANTVILIDASAVTDVSGSVRRSKVDGKVFLPRARIAYMQRLSA